MQTSNQSAGDLRIGEVVSLARREERAARRIAPGARLFCAFLLLSAASVRVARSLQGFAESSAALAGVVLISRIRRCAAAKEVRQESAIDGRLQASLARRP